jgi:hypothetical protein
LAALAENLTGSEALIALRQIEGVSLGGMF